MLAAFMAPKRHLLLHLCLGWLAACGSPPDETNPRGKAAKPEAASVDPDAEPDLRALLALDQRRFPLTVWAAYIIQHEYFDKRRLDPRSQLVSALTYLGLHTPEFFASVRDDQATITVGETSKDLSLIHISEPTRPY